ADPHRFEGDLKMVVKRYVHFNRMMKMRSLEHLDVRLRGWEKRDKKANRSFHELALCDSDGMEKSLLILFEMNGEDERVKEGLYEEEFRLEEYFEEEKYEDDDVLG
ncbi:hypothetical protein Tco_0242281, partial [Tanacetum coccineum]